MRTLPSKVLRELAKRGLIPKEDAPKESHPKKYSAAQGKPRFFRAGGIVKVMVTAEDCD